MKVDVENVLKSKKPGLARWVPGFMIRYLKRIIHQDEVNYYLENFGEKNPFDFIRSTLDNMQITYTVEGLDKLDPNGRYIFASNHPFGGLDGMILAQVIQEKFGDARVVVNDILMNLEPLKPIFIPINKHGKQSPEYSKIYNSAFASDIPIVTFPAGLCSRKKKGKVRDVSWKHSFVKQAAANDRQIVPIYFEGRLSDFFYKLSNIRNSIGLKANIEMLYLADEMFKQKRQHMRIFIGEPMDVDSKIRGRKLKRLAHEIEKSVYDMQKSAKKTE